MAHLLSTSAAAWLCGSLLCAVASAETPDPRLREVWYDPAAVVTVLVQRGIVTDIVLDADEAITDVASGLGSDCGKVDASWCIAAQPGGRHIFVKPKSTAGAPNNLAVVTDKRTHSLRLEVIGEGDRRTASYRVAIKAALPRPVVPAPRRDTGPLSLAPAETASSSQELVAGRLTSAPKLVNTSYSIADGLNSQDIVPSLVFDDGRFTYLRFANNREVPAVFHVLGDGAETLVNTRMEGDLLVVDRVSRQLVLRAGSAVVGVWNDAFDLDGIAPKDGTTVPGVERIVKSAEGRARQGAKQ